MNYQQEHGYYEINDGIYGKHPSSQRVYTTKAIECVGLYGLTKAAPKYEKPILVVANAIVWGMIYSDYKRGISLSLRW